MGTPISLFDYKLPENLIAKYPCEKRDSCRLLILDPSNGKVKDALFSDLPELIDRNSFLVVNNTKVRKARLDAKKHTGGKSEILVVETSGANTFKALVKGKFHPGDRLILKNGSALFKEKDRDGVWLMESEKNIEELMEAWGHIPLPPYMGRDEEESDKTDYQTVYSKKPSSAAAPTAGLHFTSALLENLKNRGVETVEITLDVGLGTFRPIKTQTIEEHVMHKERYEITDKAAERINRLQAEGKCLIAVGSTCVRALESAAIGSGKIASGAAYTDILISPPFNFKATGAIITNFHLPKSTLLAMAAAFGGYDAVMKAYAHAVAEKYRFFSYGDAMLIKSGLL